MGRAHELETKSMANVATTNGISNLSCITDLLPAALTDCTYV